MGRLDEIGRTDLHRLRQGVIEGQRGIPPIKPALVLNTQVTAVVAGEEGEDGLPLVVDLTPEARGHGALAIQIDD